MTVAFDSDDTMAFKDMLDDGVFSVAKFDGDCCTWVPLICA